MARPVFTLADARAEKRAADARLEAASLKRQRPALEREAFNQAERAAAAADPRVDLLMRRGRLVAYAVIAGETVEGSVAQVLERLQAADLADADLGAWYECCGGRFDYRAGKYGCPSCGGSRRALLMVAGCRSSG